MWQGSHSTNTKHHRQIDPIEHTIKHTHKYDPQHPTIPPPPQPPIHHIFNTNNSISSQNTYSFIPSHKYMSAPPPPTQINANSHHQYPLENIPTDMPSTYTIQYQLSKHKKKKKSSHKRTKSNHSHKKHHHKHSHNKSHHKHSKPNIKIKQKSIPPPPISHTHSHSHTHTHKQKRISISRNNNNNLYLPSSVPQSMHSVSNISSSVMEPIPEDIIKHINTCDIAEEVDNENENQNDCIINVIQREEEEKIGLKRITKSVASHKSICKDTTRSIKSDTKSHTNHTFNINSNSNTIMTRSMNSIGDPFNKRISIISMNPISKRDRFREKIRDKNILNDSFWEQNRKIPFIGLAMLTSTFFILIFIYFTNLYRLLFGGLVPCLISLLILLPIYWFFKKYDNALKYKTMAIQNHIEEEDFLLHENGKLYVTNKDLMKENEDLSNNLLLRCDEISKQKKKIYELSKLLAKKQAEKPNRLQLNNHKKLVVKKISKTKTLLEGFRKGQMESQLEIADVNDLVHMLPIVTSCITLLPFGMTETRKKLQRILEKRINEDHYLRMQFYFFLVSFLGCLNVQRLFRKHKIMKLVNETCAYYSYTWDDEKCNYLNSGDRVYSRKDSIASDKTITTIGIDDAFSPTTIRCDSDGNVLFDSFNKKLPPINIHSNDQLIDDNNDEKKQNNETIIYTEKDPVKLFRMPLDKNGAVGFKVIVPKNLQYRFFDPINGNKCVQQLKVRKIFNSNARPYLIDCYVNDDTTEDVMLSSAYILKRGDDLRKDGAVLKMFEFMNEIWKSANLTYKDSFVSSLTYKCIPIGPDVGIIEAIPNCIELNKVMSLRHTLKESKNVSLWNKLVASSAGAFIAAFIMGIRDRHDDNILINISDSGYNLFHIDFGYMFGDRVPLDTAKLAITSGLKNIFDIYHFGWNDFIDICIQSWLILRKNANEIIDYARCVFSFLYQAQQIEMYLRTSLKLDIADDQIASKYIHDKLKNAPKHLKTKVKNLVHGFAQKIKSNAPIGTQPVSVISDY